MESFSGKIAVVTGGGSGMGRQLVHQLAAQGCSVATCDINPGTVAETVAAAQGVASAGARVTGHHCDVADEAQVLRFRDDLLAQHGTDHLDLVFSNAGIGGAGSFVVDERAEWERVFAIDFWGMYYCARAFLPLLIAGTEGVLVNTSSVNGFWAALFPGAPQTAYATAKFAVKGLSEALIEDLRVNAPHVRVAVVMPGHVGTNIVANSLRILGVPDLEQMSDAELEAIRPELIRRGLPAGDMPPAELRQLWVRINADFRDKAPVSAEQAATVILDGVRSGTWRILIGEDARMLDQMVRADPVAAYDWDALAKLAGQSSGESVWDAS
jgi:NAD(P)-dependent dehydrogenase (short-subunit alcohol dehydrogenase family)